MLLYQISNRLVCTFYASLCIFGYIILIKNIGKFYFFLTKVTIPAALFDIPAVLLMREAFTIPISADLIITYYTRKKERTWDV